MKVSIAQIDMRLGDIEAICARIEGQAVIAREQGARLLCVPAPLISGAFPGALIESQNFVHDVLRALEDLAARLARLDIVVFVPAIVSHQGTPIFEVFMLKEERVVPIRTLAALHREHVGEDPWLPPVFDVDGLRCALTFDFERDIELVVPGCDVLFYFQASPFCAAREQSAAVASIADGHYRPQIVKRSMWLACVAPVGGFEDMAYTGGSFVMDDCGRVVAAAPCFEEALLVQDVQRGVALPAIDDHLLPQFDRTEWLWEALRLWLVDAAVARGCGKAAVLLSGDLPSSLVAALCVDAFGPRNVIGLLVARTGMRTPKQEANEDTRVSLVRELAANLHIRLVERIAPDFEELLDLDERQGGSSSYTGGCARSALGFDQVLLADLATSEGALPVSSLCKTDYALALEGAVSVPGSVAPFGDVYLTALEFLAKFRNRLGTAIPSSLVSLNSVKRYLNEVVGGAVKAAHVSGELAERMTSLLDALEPSDIDGALEGHVDRTLSFEELPLSATRPDAVALLLMLVRSGEAARRALPAYPVVSACSFVERSWPVSLAWSDMGRRGEEPKTLESFVQKEIERAESRGAEMGERMRGEILGFVSSLLGITPEQLEDLGSEEGRTRLGANLSQVEDQVQRSLQQLFEQGGASEAGGSPMPPHGFPFFSQN